MYHVTITRNLQNYRDWRTVYRS